MSTLTKQWLQQKIADMEATRDEIPFGLDEDDSNTLAALRIALASLEAEPVKRVNADQMHRVCLEANRHLDKYGAMAKEVNKLLGRAAPPAPVSVPDAYIRDERGRMMLDGKPEPRIGYGSGWNAYRDAMLKGVKQWLNAD